MTPRRNHFHLVRLVLLVPLACAAGVGVAACKASPAERRRVPPAPPAVIAASPTDAATPRVRALGSTDFAERSRAAEDLVAMGERALPALAAAGDLPVEAHGKVPVSSTKPVVAEILAHVPSERLVGAHLDSPGAAVRRGAAEELGRRREWAAVPGLIDRLEDVDEGVRIASATALRRTTNRFFGAHAGGAEGGAGGGSWSASAAVWRAWWNREGRLAAQRPASPGS